MVGRVLLVAGRMNGVGCTGGRSTGIGRIGLRSIVGGGGGGGTSFSASSSALAAVRLISLRGLAGTAFASRSTRRTASSSSRRWREISAAVSGGWIEPDLARTLRQAYVFFRALVSALRVVKGHAKDLVVPQADSDEFTLLGRRLKRAEPSKLPGEIADQARAVRGAWERLDELTATT